MRLIKTTITDGKFNETVIGTFGSVTAVNAYCKQHGYEFVRDTSLFGGYYIDASKNSYELK